MSKMSTLSFKESGRVRGSRGFRPQREGYRGAQHMSLMLVCFTLVAKNYAKWYHRWHLSPMLLKYPCRQDYEWVEHHLSHSEISRGNHTCWTGTKSLLHCDLQAPKVWSPSCVKD